MKKILLVCSAGMSTNLLVTHMEEAAEEANVEVEIFALPSSACESVLKDIDIILLSPQVRFQKAKIEGLIKEYAGKEIPIGIIDIKNYSNMDGKAVFEYAMSL